MILKYHKSLEEVKMAGRWRSNVVFKYIKKFLILSSDKLHGLEKAWIIRDEFCFQTVNRFFKEVILEEDQHALYTFNTFEVTKYVTGRYQSHNPSVLGRYVNSLIYVWNKCTQLPHLIVVIMDDDIVRYVKASAASVQIREILEWLFREYHKAITSFRDFLLTKCKRPNQPHILWIALPTHKYFGQTSNSKRIKLTECMESVIKFQENMSVLKMIKIWDPEDSNLFIYDSYRFTTQGLCKYWMAIDSAIRFWNVVIFPKLTAAKKIKTSKTPKKGTRRNDKISLACEEFVIIHVEPWGFDCAHLTNVTTLCNCVIYCYLSMSASNCFKC